MFDHEKSPYLQGAYRPVDREIEGECALIAGEVPRDLDGLLVRNGPNPKYEPRGRYHWFDGDGMLHALRIRNGKVTYKNRYVQTSALKREDAAGTCLWSGIMESIKDNPPGIPYKDTANTDVVFHNGKLKALWYLCGGTYNVDPLSLETLGKEDFGGTFKGVVSAHSKVDPITGELLFFNFGPVPPFMNFAIADREGRVINRIPIALPGPRLPHDLAFTEHYAILMDLPVVFDQKALAQGKWRTSFNRDLPSRFALVPRTGTEADVRWFEADPCYIYHTINAWEEGDEVVMVGCRVADPYKPARPEEGPWAVMMATLRIEASLYEWRFNLKTGTTKEKCLDDLNTEFPSVDLRRLGLPSRYTYNVLIGSEPTVYFDGIAKYDTSTGSIDKLVFGPGRRGSESPFAPRVGSKEEDDGYVLTLLHDEREDQSELWILDAKQPSRGPVARLRMPQRVPLGFHATWVCGDELPQA